MLKRHAYARQTRPMKIRSAGMARANSRPDSAWAGPWQSIAKVEVIWIVDAHLDDGNRFIVRSDEKLTPFLEMETAVRSGDYARS